MKLSRFNIPVFDEPRKGLMLLFNTLTMDFDELEPEYRQTYQKLKNNGVEYSPQELIQIEEMTAAGYVVSDHEAEKAKAAEWMRALSYHNDGVYRATIVTTMACNLNCVYCIEAPFTSNRTMTLETADKAFSRIIREIEDRPTKHIAIAYYGGEPLLNLPVIEHLSRRFQEWCNGTGITYSFTLSTNGTLLTREMVDRLKELGLCLAQISVDGMAEIHDKRRPFKGTGLPSFDVVMQNIKDVADILPVIIAGCYSLETEPHIYRFFDYLIDQGLDKKLDSLLFSPETSRIGDNKTSCTSVDCAINPQWSASHYVRVQKEIINRGFNLNKPLLAHAGCALALNYGHIIIAPDGYLYKCNALIDNKEYSVGHVDNENLAPFHHICMTKELWRKCLEETDCPYVYFCGNACGCRYAAFVDSGDFWHVDCQRKHYDELLPELMKLEYHRINLAASKSSNS